MQDWNPWHELIKTGLSSIPGIIVLALGWVVGQKLTFAWNVRQKRRELQLAASQQFYVAYGEFFAVWKLWNRLDHDGPSFDAQRWELHKRAASAEAIVEGSMVKLSSELKLSDAEIQTLACFRQGFQRLREAIREDKVVPWTNSEHPEYRSFKTLAAGVAGLLSREWPEKAPAHKIAAAQLLAITSNHWSTNWSESSLAPQSAPETLRRS
jgi:hypothetical protein